MKDKENQIKLLTKRISKIQNKGVKDILFIDNQELAEELLKYYQPKLPKDSVVLSKEEYKKVLNYLKEYKDKLSNFPNEVNALVDMYNKGSKEMAEKIFNELIEKANKITFFDCRTALDLDELAKQFGVEIKE